MATAEDSGAGPIPPMTPEVAPVPVPFAGAGAPWGCPGGAGPGAVAGAVPDMPAVPTAPNGEWMGQKSVGSVPGMNDSM